MKKFWNFILRYRIYIAIFIFLLVCGLLFFTMKAYLNPDDPKAVYGTRLDGIEEVTITDAKKSEIISFIKEDETMLSASMDIKGKIINIIIKTNTEDNTIDKMKEFTNSVMEKFTKEEIEFYDFQFFIKNENGNYNLIGYKNKKNQEFSWSSDEIIKEVEDENKEEE